MKRFLLIVLTFQFLLSSAEVKKEYVVRHQLQLTDVTCNRDCGFVQGITEEPFTDVDGTTGYRYRYVDDVVNMTWYVSTTALNFSIMNKSDSLMALCYEEIFGRDLDGAPVRYGNMLERPEPERHYSYIPSNTFFSGFLIPLNNYPSAKEKETEIHSLYKNTYRTRLQARRDFKNMRKKEYKVLFPVHVGNQVYNYRLTFVVDKMTSMKKSFRFDAEKEIASVTSHLSEEGAQQLPDSIVSPTLSLPARAKEITMMAGFLNHVKEYNRLCPQEKVYLHLDNTSYFQGETIWFAANVVGSTGKEKSRSKVLYVELLDPLGTIVQKQKLKVNAGRCHGSFALIDKSVKDAVEKRGAINMPSGYYQIRAYTHAMLNFDEACIYSRVVPVYVLPKNEADYAHPVMLTSSKHGWERSNDGRERRLKALTVSFYPEGGHLIAGIPCRIAFKATDQNGLGVDIDSMTDKNGLPIPLSQQHRGMGSFDYVTKQGNDEIHVVCQGKQYVFHLPEAESEGCSLTVSGVEKDSMTISVAHTALPDSLLGYMLTSCGKVLSFDTITMSRPSTKFCIDKSPLPTGVSQLTVFGASGALYAQRLLFIDNGCPTVPLEILFDKPEYRPYDPVNMHIQVGTHCAETFSLSVRDPAEHGTAYQDDIRTFMLLSSELKGLIEDPEWYFREGELERVSALDLLMMVQGWTRYDWRKMAGVEPFETKHYTEEQLVLDGWAFSRITEKPLKDVKVSVSLISPDRSKKQSATVTTDNQGYWSVGLEDFEGTWDLAFRTIQTNKRKENAATRIRLERASRPVYRSYAAIDTVLPDYSQSNALLPTWNAEEKDFMMPEDATILEDVEVTGQRLYVDYGTFKAYDVEADCEEIFDEGEYTSNIFDYLKEKGIAQASDGSLVANRGTIIICKMDSTGRPLGDKANRDIASHSDLEYIRSILVYDPVYDPDIIPCFALCSRSFNPPFYNPVPPYTVVEVTYAPFGAADRRQNNYRQTTFKGYDTPVEFYAPTYPDGPVQGDKDYRRTVYWNPEVTTDANGVANVSFYNNGYSRSLTVSAEGLTADGVPILNQ